MKELPLYQVDAFSSEPFKGNPAAVLLQDKNSASEMSDETRQKIASEMNLSETSFVELQDSKDSFKTSSHFKLRWFTPEHEARLCGHATLAAACAIIIGEGNTSESIHFHTVHSGELVVRRNLGTKGYFFAMDLPNEEPSPDIPSWARNKSPLLHSILGTSDVSVKEIVFSKRLQYLLIVLEDGTSRDQLEKIQVDYKSALNSASIHDICLAIVSTRGDSDTDFISRVFCPWAGIEEDPVTGSAHAVAGPYWSRILNKRKMKAIQCSKRVGNLEVEVLDEITVRVSGDAAIVFKGSLYIP